MNSDSKLMYFRLLPPEILEMIWEYVDPLTKSSIDRENYQKHYNYRIRNISENENVERFVRFLIVKDYAFVLRNVLIEKFDNWFNIKNYHYRYAVYPNMMHFLYNFCIQNDSQKCKQHIVDIFENRGISKNLHKKNRIRNIGWTN